MKRVDGFRSTSDDSKVENAWKKKIWNWTTKRILYEVGELHRPTSMALNMKDSAATPFGNGAMGFANDAEFFVIILDDESGLFRGQLQTSESCRSSFSNTKTKHREIIFQRLRTETRILLLPLIESSRLNPINIAV